MADWEEGFQRKVLALAIRGELSRMAPGAFSSTPFGVGANLRSPRSRIAILLEKFFTESPREAPEIETTEQLVQEEARGLGEAERAGLLDEWKKVRAQKVPDPKYVAGRVRAWALRVSVERLTMVLADAVDSGKELDAAALRRAVDESFAVGEEQPFPLQAVFANLPEHAAMWNRPSGHNRIPTGFGEVDRVLEGGPAIGESWYYLAPPKGAKTSALLATALTATRHRRGAVIFSYEMTWEKMVQRAHRSIASQSPSELRQDISPLLRAGRGFLSAGAGELYVQQFHPRKHGCEEAARVVEKLRAEGAQIDLVVLDYLNIMSSSRVEREKRHELSGISREISALGKELRTLTWSAALVNRRAVRKKVIRKDDIGEAFEVIAVLDGAIAISATKLMLQHKLRRFFMAAVRDAEDEISGGVYSVDLGRQRWTQVSEEALRELEEAAGEDSGEDDGGEE